MEKTWTRVCHARYSAAICAGSVSTTAAAINARPVFLNSRIAAGESCAAVWKSKAAFEKSGPAFAKSRAAVAIGRLAFAKGGPAFSKGTLAFAKGGRAFLKVKLAVAESRCVGSYFVAGAAADAGGVALADLAWRCLRMASTRLPSGVFLPSAPATLSMMVLNLS